MRNLLDWRPIGSAWKITVKMDHMGIGRAGFISSHRQAGDERSGPHFPLSIDVGYFAHHQEPAPDLHEVALVTKTLEVGVTTERCG